MNSNIVILDGQNGYGKTTLFDAIEVLVTGKIKHFNPSLQNRKTETLGILANDVNKDIVISAILVSDVSDEIRVERKLLCKNEFQSMITLNNQEVSQKELYDKFHLSSNMFDIGTYISQSESLDFLQNKYKNRKDAVSSLLDDTEITDKIQMLKSVQEHILGRVEKEIKDKEKQIDNYRFRRQHGVGPYILDFYCPQIKLAIELDGEVHNRQQDYDEQRSYFLNRVEDIEVLRFENRTVFENPEQIIREIEEKFSSYHLPPMGYSSSREEENGDSTVNH